MILRMCVLLLLAGIPVLADLSGRWSSGGAEVFVLRQNGRQQEIRDFLTSRRARITPEQVGLVSYGSRRVPGLRREEVAVLAGVSVPYYTRLERGDMSGASDGVLEALARALQLDDPERAHLFDLARAVQPAAGRPRRRRARQRVRPEVQWTLDAITGAAAFLGNARLDILAANQLGLALFSELYAAPARPVKVAAFPPFSRRSSTGAFRMDLSAKWTPAAAVPVKVKMPEPITAPIPKAIRLHTPSDRLSFLPGSSEAAIRCSILLVRKS